VWYDVKHHIKTSGPPIAFRLRRLEGANLEAAHHEFEALERDGVISGPPLHGPLLFMCFPRKTVYGGHAGIFGG
jgi:hypothetical protein